MGALRDFVADVLESEGAAIEPVDPDGLDVLAPQPLRTAMGWPELTRLGFGAQLPSGATAIGFEGEWLDRFGALLRERGRFAERQIMPAGPVPPAGDPERVIAHALDLPNAIWRYRGVKPSWARCLLLLFRYTAVSDDKRDGLLWLGFNQSTGAVLDEMLPRLRELLAQEQEWHPPERHVRYAAGPAWDAVAIQARVAPLLEHRVRDELAPFLGAMRRRLDRDRTRVHDYHNDLRLASLKRLAALASIAGEKAEADRKRETMRVAAIEREYAAKLDDLRHNYALRVSVEWMQRLEIFLPVLRYEILIKRRKGERIVYFDWHPALRQAEPLCCDWGLGLDRTRLICDDKLHLTDLAGQAPCPACNKAWCRPCQGAACPRCGHGDPASSSHQPAGAMTGRPQAGSR
jgi:hypothetical protein